MAFVCLLSCRLHVRVSLAKTVELAWQCTKTINLNVYVALVIRTSIALQVNKIRLYIISLELILNAFFVASGILNKFH